MTFINNLGMFLMGIRDSISPSWILNILFYTDPQTKKVHPQSKKLRDSLKYSLIKITLYIIIVPIILQIVNFFILYLIDFEYIIVPFKIVFLVLAYGYLFFYNTDVLNSTRKIIAWKQRRQPKSTFQLDRIQRIEIFTLLSGQIKGFVFLLFYYLPIFMIETKVLSFIPYVGMLCLIVSESFFNGVFYFLKTWPYDNYNVGFIEKQKYYMIGYGLFVSIICNYVLTGPLAAGGYLIISLWMLINSIVYSPPQIQFKSFNDIQRILFKQPKQRQTLKNSYNQHRLKIKQDKQYRHSIVEGIFLVYPALKITEIINLKMSQVLKNSLQKQQKRKASSLEGQKQEDQTQQTKLSQSYHSSNDSFEIGELDQSSNNEHGRKSFNNQLNSCSEIIIEQDNDDENIKSD